MAKDSLASLLATAATLLLAGAPPLASAFAPKVRYQGREWSPAQPTGTVSPAEAVFLPGAGDVSPAPTEAPSHPDFGAVELFKRQFVKGSDTCGFAAQLKSEPWTCYRVGASCVSYSTAMGCCLGSEPDCHSTILETCQDYTRGAPSSSCGLNTLCCQSASPSCFTWRYSASDKPQNTYSIFNCYEQGGFGTLVDTPPALTLTAGGPTTQTTASRALNPDTTKGSATTAPTQAPAPAPNPNSSSSSNNIGAIVGGAVGGVAIIAAVVVAIFWIMMRSKRAKSKTAGGAGGPGAGAAAFSDNPNTPGFSPGPSSVSPATVPAPSPQMNQSGYFVVPQHQQQHQQQPPQDPRYSYYDPAKGGQPSPAYSDPRYSMMQPQHTGGGSPAPPPNGAYGDPNMPVGGPGSHWSTPPPPPHPTGPQQPPMELGTTNPVGTTANRAELL